MLGIVLYDFMPDIGVMRKYDKYGGRVAQDGERPCDHPDCSEPGEFRAPRSRDARSWYWFCLDHVRAFNAGWNYFDGFDSQQISRAEASRHTWNRPTWKLGDPRQAGADQDLFDPLDIFPDTPGFGARFADVGRTGAGGRRLGPQDLEALTTLGLDADADLGDIRGRYRQLLRELHPDTNGGDRRHEKKLQAVIAAYKHLTTTIEAAAE